MKPKQIISSVWRASTAWYDAQTRVTQAVVAAQAAAMVVLLLLYAGRC